MSSLFVNTGLMIAFKIILVYHELFERRQNITSLW
jgi:hypothetical protein